MPVGERNEAFEELDREVSHGPILASIAPDAPKLLPHVPACCEMAFLLLVPVAGTKRCRATLCKPIPEEVHHKGAMFQRNSYLAKTGHSFRTNGVVA